MTADLLFYLSHESDPQRFAVGPTLAAAAERAGWEFDCYYAARRRGRHFGGGDPGTHEAGWANGGLVAGGLHAEQLLWLATRFHIVALGDPDSPLWPVLEAAEAEILIGGAAPADLYRAAFERLEQPLPGTVAVVDAAPQGRHGIIAAPYLLPGFGSGDPVLGVEASAASEQIATVTTLTGGGRLVGWFVDHDRAATVGLAQEAVEGEVGDSSYAEFTAELVRRHAGWGRGVFLGDPDLVAAQTARVHRDRLVPLYGTPQTDVVARAAGTIRAATPPVYGRQYDDRDFFELAKLGHGLQVVDPAPPFPTASRLPLPSGSSARGGDEAGEPDDATLRVWAGEGRVPATLLFWGGMLREVECWSRIVDLVSTTGLRAGVIVTAEVLEALSPSTLALLSVSPDRGGVAGLLEPLLGSTGRAVAAESFMPPGTLHAQLEEARSAAQARLPATPLNGWWPLLDTELVRHRNPPVTRRGLRPVLRFTPRGDPSSDGGGDTGGTSRPDARAVTGAVARRLGLDRLFEERRPFDAYRPGALDERVAAAVASAGFGYMFTKSSFGNPVVAYRNGGFVALPLTAGNWDGWSPFYTVSRPADIRKAERRLVRGKHPGWLVGTIDSPLWMLSGEVLEHGARIYEVAAQLAAGGSSGRLVNATPNTIARYARLL